MTDVDTQESAPWPVPAGTLISPGMEETMEALAFVIVPGPRSLEDEVLHLLEKRPEKGTPLHDVWMHDLAVLVDRLDFLVEKVKTVSAEAQAAFCRDLPFPAPSNISYADTRPMVPRFPKNRTAWDNESLATDLRAKVLDQVVMAFEFSDREDVVGAAQVAMGQMERLVTLSGSNAKTTGIKALGLDPDDYCTSEKQDPQLQVIR